MQQLEHADFQTTRPMGLRTLTDADVEAITSSLERRMVYGFYRDLGKGVWGLAKKAFFIAIAALAAYGYMKGGK